MNTKKLLSALLVSLGAFTLVLTGCGEKPTPNPTDEPTSDTSVAPTDEPTTVEPTSDEQPTSDVPTTEEPTTEEPTSDVPTSDVPTSDEPTSDEPTSDVPTDEPIKPEATLYDVTFNYDEATENLTVWTDYAIDGTIAPNATNVSEQEGIEERHTVPLATGGLDCGIYFFAVDANGYIVYASYGLGVGYGAPGDGYYHNQAFKDVYDAPNWSIHDEWAAWPNKTEDGRNAWTLYDFIIPEGGFVVRGHADEANMKEFWKQITGQFSVPKSTNQTLEGSTASGALNNFYLSINEDHQLEVRERTPEETIVDGVQEEDTPSQRFTPTDADQPVEYVTIEAVNALEDNATVEGVRGVITHMNGANVTIQDEDGNAILLYDNQLKEGYAVGDTIVLSGTKTTYNGHPEIKSLTSLTKIEKYGRLPAVAAREVTAENVAEAWVIENNYGLFKLVKAQVKELGQSAKVQLGDVEITLYKVHMPETVAVGDYVDVVCSMQAYNDQVQGRTASTADVSRYYNVTVDVDGVDGVDPVVSAHASGASVTMTAKHEDPNYSFSHWEKLVGETWEQVSTEPTQTITVGEVDEQYRAVFTYAAWALLPDTYAEALVETPDKVNGDAGGDAFAVLTEGVLHTEGAWTSGAFNTSWRTIIVVDKDGKIAYAVSNPANGYGGPSGTGYYAHPDYADYTLNPAFNILEGYGPWTAEAPDASKKFEIVVPEGGFILTAHGTDGELLWTTLGAEAGAGDAGHNNREALDDSARVYYDEANGLVRVYRDEADANATLNGIINATSSTSASVYVPGAESVTLGDFTVAVDANGVVIFAGRTSSGYGGPADGFYHDGSYAWAAGQTCGIFQLHEKFAGWPNKAEVDGVEVNAWTLYTVVVPEGGAIVTGTWAQMSALMQTIDPAAVEAGNYFEGVADGMFNETVKVEVAAKSKVANVNVTVTEAETSEGLAWGGASMGDFELVDGVYKATISLNAWNAISFTYTDAEGNQVLLTYDNTTFTGRITSDPTVFGAYAEGAGILFIEEGWPAEGKFMASDACKLDISYDRATNTLTVADHVEEEPPVVEPPVVEPEEVQLKLDLSGASVLTSGEARLGDFTVALDANGKIIYAGKTASGYGGPADGFYHDGSYAWEAGKTCGIFQLHEKFAGWPNKAEVDGVEVNAWTLYTVVVPEGGMIITGTWEQMAPIMQAIDANAVEDGNYFEGVEDGKFNNVVVSEVEVVSLDATTAGAAVFTGAEGETVALGDYAIALDANGKLIYASRYNGYGGPADGFYHDGSYELVKGGRCGIFQVDEKFAGWPNKVEIDGVEVNAWTLYTVVVPEGGKIITGSWEQMAAIMQAIDANAVADGNFFEGVEDGKYNEVKFEVK